MPLNLTIKPAQTELVAKPGVTITQAYTITNQSSTSVTLTTEVLPWVPVGTDGSVSYQTTRSPSHQFSLSNSDLSLGQKFTLKPGENRQLVLKIKSTPDTPLADSYYTFFVSQDFFGESSASARLGSHLLLSTSNSETINSDLSLSNFSVSPLFKDIFFPRLVFSAQIDNSSSHYAKPEGKLTITKNNLVIQELDIFPNNVLAHHSRDLMCNQNNEPVPCTLSPPFWPGAYTATIKLNSTTVTTTFFVLPYSLLFASLIIGFLFYILITRRN